MDYHKNALNYFSPATWC